MRALCKQKCWWCARRPQVRSACAAASSCGPARSACTQPSPPARPRGQGVSSCQSGVQQQHPQHFLGTHAQQPAFIWSESASPCRAGGHPLPSVATQHVCFPTGRTFPSVILRQQPAHTPCRCCRSSMGACDRDSPGSPRQVHADRVRSAAPRGPPETPPVAQTLPLSTGLPPLAFNSSRPMPTPQQPSCLDEETKAYAGETILGASQADARTLQLAKLRAYGQ